MILEVKEFNLSKPKLSHWLLQKKNVGPNMISQSARDGNSLNITLQTNFHSLFDGQGTGG